jgi:hypothetical protein
LSYLNHLPAAAFPIFPSPAASSLDQLYHPNNKKDKMKIRHPYHCMPHLILKSSKFNTPPKKYDLHYQALPYFELLRWYLQIDALLLHNEELYLETMVQQKESSTLTDNKKIRTKIR